jgi:D-alanyl-D-alanine-carboxypeptidase/D-alanyl-D-alanine-endopeptidase
MAKTTDRRFFPSDADIHARLVDLIDVRALGVGAVVGLIDADGWRIVAHGEMEKGGGRPVDGDTLFEIGSATKVFTALLLAQMAERGELGLDDPVARYLPQAALSPNPAGRQITLFDLATHTSGLPTMDPRFRTTDPDHPLALKGQGDALSQYTEERLYGFLRERGLGNDSGGRYAYSNIGFGLLGHVLALRAGMEFETLLRERITAPLGMRDTVMTVPDALKPRLAAAHSSRLQPVARLGLQVLAGAGAICATAHDLLDFLAAELGHVKTPLAAAMQAQLIPRVATNVRGQTSALAWRVATPPGRESVSHGGATVGSVAFMGFDGLRGVGVVTLTNARTEPSLGPRLLAGAPLRKTWRGAAVEAPDAEAFDRYVGRYQLPGAILRVTRDSERLRAQLSIDGWPQPRPLREIELRSVTHVCWKYADVEADFELDADGRAIALTMPWRGGDARAERLPDP